MSLRKNYSLKEVISFLPLIALKGQSVPVPMSEQGKQGLSQPSNAQSSSYKIQKRALPSGELKAQWKVWSRQRPSPPQEKALPYSAFCPDRTGAG